MEHAWSTINKDIFLRLKGKIPTKKVIGMLMGLIDGDGYIYIGESKKKDKNKLSTIILKIVIKLHIRDKLTLNYIVKEIGVGRIDYLKWKSTEYVRMIINKKDIKNVIIPLINKYEIKPLTKIRILQYNILKEIIEKKIKYWKDIDKEEINKNIKDKFYLYKIIYVTSLDSNQ